MDVKRRELIKGITATAAFSIAAPSMTFASPIERAMIHLRQSSASIIKPKPMTAPSVGKLHLRRRTAGRQTRTNAHHRRHCFRFDARASHAK